MNKVQSILQDSNTFFLSDPHFGHNLVSKKRGFATPEAHDETLINNICSQVPQGGNLVVLGDISVRKTYQALEVLDNIKKHLNLKSLILVPGNHDEIHPMFGVDTNMKWRNNFNNVFDLVVTQFDKHFDNKYRTVFSHIPGNEAENQYAKQRTIRYAPNMDYYDVNVHGHTHSDILVDGCYVNLSLEATRMRTVSLEELMIMMDIAYGNNQAYMWEDIFTSS